VVRVNCAAFDPNREWEHAARAGTSTSFYTGNTTGNWFEDECDRPHVPLKAAAWFQCNSGWRTHPVAQKARNAWGLYDMLGNVYEYVEDRYSTLVDGVWQCFGNDCDHRVMRGGSWIEGPIYLRSASRLSRLPSEPSTRIGFRVARSLE
jgi:formylglycine-generating enzyme required for sulfatase activity